MFWGRSSDLVVVAFATSFLFLLATLGFRRLKTQRHRLPPRVPGLPIFGNTFQFPLKNAQQARWGSMLAEKYGEMFTLRLGSSDWVFLNSSRTVIDILEKRAAVTSSRLDLPMAQDIMSQGRRVLFMKYGEKWRGIRKILHNILNSRKMINFSSHQDRESRQMLSDILKYPDRCFTSFQRYTNAVVVGVVFGRRPQLDDANLQPLFTQTDEVIKAMQPGANIVAGIPALARLPRVLQWWRPKGERLFFESVRVYQIELDRIKSLMADGKAPDCFAVDLLKATHGGEMDELQKLFVLGTLLEAGSDTSRVVLGQIVAAAICYPEWAQTAREHLDRVCGRNAERLPDWQDRSVLQYITAVVKEGLRWRPMVTLGVPHVLTSDEKYEDYYFPAGTVFTWNAHYIALNPDEYEDPEKFMPERFLNEDVDAILKGHFGLGLGRRVCVGYNVAATNLWMAVARLLYCFDLEAVPGYPINSFNTDWLQFEEPPFALNIRPRSPKHVELIEKSFAGMQE